MAMNIDSITCTIVPYRADHPDTPTIGNRQQTADGEPALPGWPFA